MRHPEVQGGGGDVVGEDALEADEEQPGGEGHASSDVVQGFGVVHLRHRQRC